MFLERHLPLFLDYLSAEKGLAANTLEAYRRDLAGFGAFLAERSVDPGKVSRGDVVAYLGARRAEGMSPRTLARETSALRGLYGFLAAEKVVSEDPTADLTNARRWAMLPKVLSEVEVQKLLDAPNVAQMVVDSDGTLHFGPRTVPPPALESADTFEASGDDKLAAGYRLSVGEVLSCGL